MKKISKRDVASGTAAVLAGAVFAVGASAGVEYVVDHHRTVAATPTAQGHQWSPGWTPDPYNLRDGHWPQISEKALSHIEAVVLGWMTVPPDLPPGAPARYPSAATVAADYVTLTGPAMLRQIHVDPTNLLAAGGNAGRLRVLTGEVADAVTWAKYDIDGLVAEGAQKADAAEEGHARDVVVTDYRAKIATRAGELDTELIKLGREVGTPVAGTVPWRAGVSIFRLPQPGGEDLRVDANGFQVVHHRVIGDRPIVAMLPSPPPQQTVETPTR